MSSMTPQQLEAVQFYFEDLAEGQWFISARRTITEADIVGFAGISGDFNPLHMDAVHAATHPYGQRAAHGLLVLSIASGLCSQMPVSRATSSARIALLGVECRWLKPVHIGDTIQVEMRVADKKDLPTRSDAGAVTFDRSVKNQRGVVVLRSQWDLLLRKKTPDAPASV